jgi:phage terminase large subunit-like protein
MRSSRKIGVLVFHRPEDELTAITADGAKRHSPDRADAMVWALTDLVLRGPGRAAGAGL